LLNFIFIVYETTEYAIKDSGDKVIDVCLKMDVSILGELVVVGAYTRESGFKAFWSKVKALF
jgi:hypothetical protein